MRFISIFVVLFLTACSSIDQATHKENPETCSLDYTPYQATVTGYCKEAAAALPKEIPTFEKEIELRAIKDIPEVFWYSSKMKYSVVK